MTIVNPDNHGHPERRWPAYVLSWKVGLPLAALLLAVSGVMAYRESQLSGLPDIGHPFDVEEFYAIDVPLGENAWPDYQSAFALAVPAPQGAQREIDATLDQGWHKATPFVRRWLEDNRPPLVRWRSGTEKPACLRVHPREINLESYSRSYTETERFLNLASLEALRVVANGDLQGAWRWHRATFRFSRHRGMHDTFGERWTGLRSHEWTLHPISSWAAHEALTPAELQEALSDLRDDFRLTAPPSMAFKYSYIYGIDFVDHLNELRESYASLAEHWPEFAIPSPPVLFLTNQPEVTRRLQRHQIANALPHCDKLPRDQPPSASDVLYYDAAVVTERNLLSAADFVSTVQRFPSAKIALLSRWPADEYVRERAYQAALEVTLAAECYRRVHGELPQDLSQLVTADILPHVPDDPWSPVPAPVRYERDPANPSRAKVWSVGQNGVDDGGEIGPADNSVGDVGLWIGGEPDSE